MRPAASTGRAPLGRQFGTVWFAQSISLLGSQVTLIALPLTAITLLGAGPGEMGLLVACGKLPYLLFGLYAGALVDRWPRRLVVIVSNLALAGVLATVPAAAMAGHLSLAQLYIVATVTGILTVLFDIAYLAYVPEIVEHDQLTRAQSRLEMSQSLALILDLRWPAP